MNMMTIPKLLGACALLTASMAASALPTPQDVEAAVRAENWPQAETMLLEVTAKKPNNAKAWYFLAQTEEKLGKFGSAQSDLSRAEKLDPAERFASPGSVSSMEQRLSSELAAVQAPVQTYHATSVHPYSPPVVHDSGVGALGVVFALLFTVLLFWILWRIIAGPRVVTTYGGGGYVGGPGGGYVSGPGTTTVINNGNNGTGLLSTMILADAIRDEHRDHYRDDDYSGSQQSQGSSWDAPSAPAPSNDRSSFDMGGSSGGWSSSDSSSSGSSCSSSSSSSCSSSSGSSDW